MTGAASDGVLVATLMVLVVLVLAELDKRVNQR